MKKSQFTTLMVILLAGTLIQIGMDVYTPSLPAISVSLHAPIGQVQSTLTIFIFGVAITNLFYGPLSEFIGRRQTMLIGNLIALVGTVMCLYAHHIHLLQWGRLIQGVGLGACAALWRSIFRDTYEGKDMATVASYLINVIIVSMILAPIIGGYLQEYYNWHASFIFLLVWIATVTLLIHFNFDESRGHHDRQRFSWGFIRKSYTELLASRVFVGMSVSVLLTYGGLFAWIMMSPVILINDAMVTPANYGLLLIATGLAMGAGGLLNARLLRRYDLSALLCVGWSLMFLSGAIMYGLYCFYGINIVMVVLPATLFTFGSSMIYANAVAIAFKPFGHIAGVAGALYNCIQLLGGVLFGAILMHLTPVNQAPLACLFMISPLFAWVVFKLLVAKRLQLPAPA